MRIEVTLEDIALGMMGNAHSCAIALAAVRAGMDHPEVDCDIYADDGRHYSMTAEALKFMEDFDAGKPVQPFVFEANLVEDEEEEPYDDGWPD